MKGPLLLLGLALAAALTVAVAAITPPPPPAVLVLKNIDGIESIGFLEHSCPLHYSVAEHGTTVTIVVEGFRTTDSMKGCTLQVVAHAGGTRINLKIWVTAADYMVLDLAREAKKSVKPPLPLGG